MMIEYEEIFWSFQLVLVSKSIFDTLVALQRESRVLVLKNSYFPDDMVQHLF